MASSKFVQSFSETIQIAIPFSCWCLCSQRWLFCRRLPTGFGLPAWVLASALVAVSNAAMVSIRAMLGLGLRVSNLEFRTCLMEEKFRVSRCDFQGCPLTEKFQISRLRFQVCPKWQVHQIRQLTSGKFRVSCYEFRVCFSKFVRFCGT